MVFPLTKMNKEGTLLNPSYAYYTEEYAQRMCSLYLTDELNRDETGTTWSAGTMISIGCRCQTSRPMCADTPIAAIWRNRE